MNDSCLAIEKAFRELVGEMPYRSITVGDICERAHLSRKSFYANYHNKEDIVSRMFIKDSVKPLREINAIFSRGQGRDMYQVIQQKIYEKIYEDKDFYRSLIGPMKGVDDTFIRVATNAIYDFNAELLSEHKIVSDPQKMDYVAYFFASSQAMLMQKWIYDGFLYTPEELSAIYDEMIQSYWLSTYDGFAARHGRRQA